MAAQSKETNEQKESRLVRSVGPAVFLTIAGQAMLFTARQAFAGPLFSNNKTDLTTFLTRLTSCAAFTEFLVNPVFGKLSDTYGRRAVISLGSWATMLCRMVVFFNPAATWPLIMEGLITTPLITSFFTTWRASVSDNLEGSAFARTNAKIGVCAGLAIVSGPFLSKTVLNSMDAKYCFLVSSFLSALCLLHLNFNFKESLPQENRKPLKLADMQPFSFWQLMGKSKDLRTLMWVTGLQTTSEGRNVNDIYSIYMQNDLGWSWDQINNFVGAMGVALVFSGLGVKRMIATLGLRSFTTVCNVCNICSMALYSNCPPMSYALSGGSSMWIGLLFAIPGARKRDVVEALVMKIGAGHGFGKGFISGSLMNWRAVINVVGPVLFGTVYNLGARNNFPGFVFLVASLTVVAAEMTLQTLPASLFDELSKKEKAQKAP